MQLVTVSTTVNVKSCIKYTCVHIHITRVSALTLVLSNILPRHVGASLRNDVVCCSYFYRYYNTILGNCFVFNSGWDGFSLRQSHRTGRRYGLKLVVDIRQWEYLPHLTDAAGIRVVVHPQERMPFPQDEGIVAAPAMLTSIGIRQVSRFASLSQNFVVSACLVQ